MPRTSKKNGGNKRVARAGTRTERDEAPVVAVARELGVSEHLLYAWLRKGGYEKPWKDRRRIIEVASIQCARKPEVRERALELLAAAGNGHELAVEPAGTERRPGALSYLRLAEAALVSDACTMLDRLHRGDDPGTNKTDALSRALRLTVDAIGALEGPVRD